MVGRSKATDVLRGEPGEEPDPWASRTGQSKEDFENKTLLFERSQSLNLFVDLRRSV